MGKQLKSFWLSACLAALCGTAAADAPPAFDARFSDGMVLQQGMPVAVSGTSDPLADVSVAIGAARALTRADEIGRWRAELPPLPAGTGLILEADSGDSRAVLSNISVGDVFLCSGQSNMAHPVSRALNPDTELAGPFPADIHLLKVPEKSSVTPQGSLPEGSHWQAASRETVENFSALCYFFGRDWQASQNVPVGLIGASWGGSRIEAWISPQRLRKLPHLADRLDLLALYASDPAAATRKFGQSWQTWWTSVAGTSPWADGLTGATPVPGPLRDWKSFGDADIETHLGMLWYEKRVTLNETEAKGPAQLSLGGIDEIDSAWVNGAFVGTSFGWGTHRTYDIPDGTLRAGENRILINVHNGWGQGGMVGPEDALKITTASGKNIPVGQGWTYEKVDTALGQAPQTPWMSVSGLSGMHHGMISPLAGLNLRGALWYQGESNTGDAETYQSLLSLLTEDLRRQFGETLPLLVIQLPEFGPRMTVPGQSGWSALRNAQRRFVSEDARTGLVVALGAGDEWDIHPPNKQEVARRTRTVWDALLNSPDAPERTGHSPDLAVSEAPFVKIALPEAGGNYKTSGHSRPIGFLLCRAGGADCTFAEAWVRGDTIEIDNPYSDAAIVRYCWGDTPVCNLMTPEGQPVTPFELTITQK